MKLYDISTPSYEGKEKIKKMTKGQIEAKISEAMIKFEMEHMGRGPEEARTYVIKDMIFIRLKGVLTTAEKRLAKDVEGKLLVKQTRLRLLENSRNILEELVQNITGSQIISMHTDISTKTGERIIVFTVDKNLEGKISS
ncbi:MAG: DUF2294 domain-containing protein [bacterium]